MIFFSILAILRTPTVADLVKDTYFEFTSKESGIRVVHFYTKNCPACLDVEPVFEELSRMYWQEERVRFGQFDCDRFTDVCDSCGARDHPSWFVWLPAQSHSKRYNRNIDPEAFTKWIRQQTGIWPHSGENNLLYYKTKSFEELYKKSGCTFTIFDSPRMPESQAIHNASRTLEKIVKKGSKFAAVDVNENKQLAKKVIGDKSFGAYVYSKGKWSEYDGGATDSEVLDFLKKKCQITVATPTPTPEPLPDLEDLPEEEFIPIGEIEDDPEPVQQKAPAKAQMKEEVQPEVDEEDNEDSDWEI